MPDYALHYEYAVRQIQRGERYLLYPDMRPRKLDVLKLSLPEATRLIQEIRQDMRSITWQVVNLPHLGRMVMLMDEDAGTRFLAPNYYATALYIRNKWPSEHCIIRGICLVAPEEDLT